MRFDFDPSQPIYQQIIDSIKRALVRGELSPGDRIPSQRELAQEARVNPNTVQRAYREMEQAGLVETLRGMGTFIGQDPGLLERIRHEMATEAVRRFIADLRALGHTSSEIINLATEALRESEAE